MIIEDLTIRESPFGVTRIRNLMEEIKSTVQDLVEIIDDGDDTSSFREYEEVILTGDAKTRKYKRDNLSFGSIYSGKCIICGNEYNYKPYLMNNIEFCEECNRYMEIDNIKENNRKIMDFWKDKDNSVDLDSFNNNPLFWD